MTETITPAELRLREAKAMPERGRDGLQQQVMDLLKETGFMAYHTFDSRKSAAGFPDIVAIRDDRCLVIELKQEGEEPTPDQFRWLQAWRRVSDYAHDRVMQALNGYDPIEVYVWYPLDLLDGTIHRVLTGSG